MKAKIRARLVAFWIAACTGGSLTAGDGALLVYEHIPGAIASDQYSLSVRPARDGESWQEAFPLITRCKKAEEGENNYFAHLEGWTNTYINFEMSEPVEVEIVRKDGEPILTAVPRPGEKAHSCVVKDGKAYITITDPCLIAVDINGQMDRQDTGFGYSGKPIHTVTIFANPVITDRPAPDGEKVVAVSPGEIPPSDGDWETLYFLPGAHDIGAGFPVHAGRNYYIPGDAIVYGTMNNHGKWDDGRNIRIFGYGTLSGARLAHPEFASPPPKNHHLHTPIYISGASNTRVEGVTIADSAYHSLMLVTPYDREELTVMRWLKIFTWRRNGDGINPFGNGLIEDCFIRTQDDCAYVNGRGIRRVTFWNDYNGSALVLSALPDRSLIVEDCDIIYARAGWNEWSGGRLFNMRGEGGGECGKGVIFRNIRVEDPRPTLQHFMIAMQGVEPYSDPAERLREPGDFSGVLFQNIEITAPSVMGETDVLWGAPGARIVDVTFDNVTVGGKKVMSLDHFKHNAHVEGVSFK